MSKEQDSRINKIQALLAKAQSTEFDAEKEIFEAKAMKLMAKWEIADRDLTTEPKFLAFHLDATEHGRFCSGIIHLWLDLAILHGGYGFIHTARGSGKMRASTGILYIEQHNYDILETFMTHFIKEMKYAFINSPTTSRQGFSMGFSLSIADRLREKHRAAYSGYGALVPTNTEAESFAYESLGMNPSRMKKFKMQLGSGDFGEGYLAGNKVDLLDSKIDA